MIGAGRLAMMPRAHSPQAAGYTLLEILLVIALAGTLAASAVPLASTTIDHLHTAAAARHVAGRIAMARLDAVRRATTVAMRFESSTGTDYVWTSIVDGNANGVRASDVTRGIDRVLTAPERLANQFPGTMFGLMPGVPDLDGAQGTTDGVRIGSTSFLSLSPHGSATSGTLYIHGRRRQYAVRILGATGRVRLFEYDTGARRWITK